MGGPQAGLVLGSELRCWRGPSVWHWSHGGPGLSEPPATVSPTYGSLSQSGTGPGGRQGREAQPSPCRRQEAGGRRHSALPTHPTLFRAHPLSGSDSDCWGLSATSSLLPPFLPGGQRGPPKCRPVPQSHSGHCSTRGPSQLGPAHPLISCSVAPGLRALAHRLM